MLIIRYVTTLVKKTKCLSIPPTSEGIKYSNQEYTRNSGQVLDIGMIPYLGKVSVSAGGTPLPYAGGTCLVQTGSLSRSGSLARYYKLVTYTYIITSDTPSLKPPCPLNT